MSRSAWNIRIRRKPGSGKRKTYLKLGTQRDNADLVRPNNNLASPLDTLVEPNLRHAIGKQQQNKAAVQEVYSKKIRHEGQLRIASQNARHRVRSSHGMGRALYEPHRRDPAVLVVEHGHRVPFSVEENMKNMEDERAVRCYQLGLGVAAGVGARRCRG